MKKITIFLFFVFSLNGQLDAQSKKFMKNYTLAKNAFQQQNYTLAISLFNQVFKLNEENNLTEKAYFYYALAALKSGQTSEAQVSFEKILTKYPNLKEETLYQLADIAFRNRQNEQALNYLSQIKSPSFKNDVASMKGYHLQQLDMLALRMLHQNFPKDTLLVQCVVDKIATTSESYEDLDLMDELITNYQVNRPTQQRLKRKVIKRQTAYKVAVLLPFDYEKMKSRDTTTVGKLAISMYQGMRIAKKELDTLNGTKVVLYAYDINRDAENKIDKFVQEQEWKDIDLIISPLFENLYRKVADFAAKQKVNMINPISFDSRLLLNKFTYLYEPTTETQARQSVEFVKQKFSNKTVLIFYDNLARNKSFANLCKQNAEKEGLKVLAFEELGIGDLMKMNEILAKFNSTEVGSIFVISTSQLIAGETIKIIKNKIYDVPLFVPNAWLTFQDIDYAEYEKLNVHFIYPEYLDTETPGALRFKKAYLEFARQEPGTYSYVGYEIIHYFANLLEKYGTNTDFSNILKNSKPEKGKIEASLDFSKGNDNHFVPILKIKDGEPSLVMD